MAFAQGGLSWGQAAYSVQTRHILLSAVSFMATLIRTDHGVIGSGRAARALLDQPIKELASDRRIPAVESECIFVEVMFELMGRGAAMKGAQQPSLEQRGDAMDSRQLFMTRSRQS